MANRNKLQIWTAALLKQPGYSFMRIFARFSVARALVTVIKGWTERHKAKTHVTQERLDIGPSVFRGIDGGKTVVDLTRDGAAFGLRPPEDVVSSIRKFADRATCYADRNPANGFLLTEKEEAEQALGKPILACRYVSLLNDRPEIQQLMSDPLWCDARC